MSEILESVGLKTCTKCEQTLPVSEFHKCGKYLQSRCKACQRVDTQKYRDENRDYVNEQQRQWRNKNSEHFNEYRLEYAHEYYKDPVNARKAKVISITNAAIARGELIRPDACPECGANEYKVQAHHWSYEVGDELDVIWLCPRCHAALHQRNRID